MTESLSNFDADCQLQSRCRPNGIPPLNVFLPVEDHFASVHLRSQTWGRDTAVVSIVAAGVALVAAL